MFQVPITSIKENAIYTVVAPTLQELQRDMKVPEDEIYDVIPKNYGARISLNDGKCLFSGTLNLYSNFYIL